MTYGFAAGKTDIVELVSEKKATLSRWTNGEVNQVGVSACPR